MSNHITIHRALLEQALEALELVTEDYDDSAVGLEIDAIQALRAELAKPAAPAWHDTPGVVWKATSLTGDTAHFGVRSAAKAWARSGTVEPVPLKHLRLVPLGTDCGPECRQCGMTCRRARQIDEQFAPKLAIELECMLIDHARNRASAEKTLDAYRAAWDAINPGPATLMGEPIEDRSDCHGPDWTDRDGEYLK